MNDSAKAPIQEDVATTFVQEVAVFDKAMGFIEHILKNVEGVKDALIRDRSSFEKIAKAQAAVSATLQEDVVYGTMKVNIPNADSHSFTPSPEALRSELEKYNERLLKQIAERLDAVETWTDIFETFQDTFEATMKERHPEVLASPIVKDKEPKPW